MPTSPDQTDAAFDLLLSEIDKALETLRAQGGQAFVAGDYSSVEKLKERARAIEAFKERAQELKREWRQLASEPAMPGAVTPRRQPHGVLTPEGAYRVPILKALVELGGSGSSHTVIGRVYEQMKGILNDADRAPSSSDPQRPKWHNRTEWCRNTMREEGLIRSDSRRGTWEISAAGRAWLAERERAARG